MLPNKQTKLNLATLLIAAALCMAGVSYAAPMGTAFTYQGRLADANSPAEGLYDFEFAVFDALDGGSQQGSTLSGDDLDVIDGYFTVTLDFGAGVFTGDARWLQIAVRPGTGAEDFTTLGPRQELTPTPYALHTRWLQVDTALNNVFLGQEAGVSNTTGLYNSAMGYEALYSNTTGWSNSAMGYQALWSNTEGYRNSAMGYEALYSNTTGWSNSAMGYHALWTNTESYRNSAMGYDALYSNTTGFDNSAMGYKALRSNTEGYRNSAMGYLALGNNTDGDGNSAVGFWTLRSNTTGVYNSAMGYEALGSNTDGDGNSAVGFWTLLGNTTGVYNSAIGFQAGYHNSTGSHNVFIGHKAGYNETGSNKLYIANSDVDPPLIYGDFATNRIGINRVPTANTFEVGGNASKAVAGSWLANSDARIKADIKTVTNALETLDKVRLVSFKYTDDYRTEHPSIEKRRYLNVIAQEFAEVFPEYVKSSKEKLPNGDEILQVDAYPLTVYSAAAVQELHAIVKAKDARLAAQDAEITAMKERLAKMEAAVSKLINSNNGGQL